MKFVLILTLICVSYSYAQTTTDTVDYDKLLEQLIKIAIFYVELVLQKKGEINLITNQNDSFSATGIFEGYLKSDRLYLDGLKALILNESYIIVKSLLYKENFTSLQISFNISIPNKVTLYWKNYDMDLGTFDLLPLYGNGNVFFTTYFINIYFHIDLSFHEKFKINYLDVKPFLSIFEAKISGFWRNDELSDALAAAIKTFGNFFVILWDLEYQCITCGLSSLIESLVNSQSKTEILEHLYERCSGQCVRSSNYLINSAFEKKLDLSQNDLLHYINVIADYIREELEKKI